MDIVRGNFSVESLSSPFGVHSGLCIRREPIDRDFEAGGYVEYAARAIYGAVSKASTVDAIVSQKFAEGRERDNADRGLTAAPLIIP